MNTNRCGLCRCVMSEGYACTFCAVQFGSIHVQDDGSPMPLDEEKECGRFCSLCNRPFCLHCQPKLGQKDGDGKQTKACHDCSSARCKWYASSECRYGNNCYYSHRDRKTVPCFREDRCKSGPQCYDRHGGPMERPPSIRYGGTPNLMSTSPMTIPNSPSPLMFPQSSPLLSPVDIQQYLAQRP
mmetsp:Transcript_18598/g.71766  ORF Transcript_18598/g.71766 Transcript_18598/m.71766 type:complete len:184 (+) Transcript_18598:61-612(+)